MRYAIVENALVANVALAEQPLAENWIASEAAQIGDAWDGEHFTTPAVVAAVPQILSPRQFRQALTHFTLRATVEAAVAAADQDTKDWYEFATQFERRHPRVVGMAQALGYGDAQVDAVWTYGASL